MQRPCAPHSHPAWLAIKKNFFLIYFLSVLGLHCCMDFSLVVASRGYSLVVRPGFLIAVASLAREHVL